MRWHDALQVGPLDGALAPEALLTVERVGKDAIVMPVAGIIGCQPAR